MKNYMFSFFFLKGFFQFVGEGKNQGHLLRSTPGNGLTLMKKQALALFWHDI